MIADGENPTFAKVQVSGSQAAGKARVAGLDFEVIGSESTSLLVRDTTKVLGHLSRLVGVELAGQLDRRATAKRVFETMHRADFSVLRSLVFIDK